MASLPIRIYYEDTDLGGVVYYANYLKFFERGRTEYLREKGLELSELHESGIVFVVVRAEINYHAPARYGDLIDVETTLSKITGASITFEHKITIEAGEKPLVTGTVTLACTEAGRPVRIPERVREVL